MPDHPSKHRFCLVLVKPSHYDDDGYVIQWFRSAIPANSLACLYGLAKECADNKTLGENVKLEIHAFDETNTVIRPTNTISPYVNPNLVPVSPLYTGAFPSSIVPRNAIADSDYHLHGLTAGVQIQW